MNRETPTLRVNWTGHGYLNAAAMRALGMPSGILIDIVRSTGGVVIRPAHEDDHRPTKVISEGAAFGNFNARNVLTRAGLVPESGSAKYLLTRIMWDIGRPAYETCASAVLTPEESLMVRCDRRAGVPA